jgi:hypothetical protein
VGIVLDFLRYLQQQKMMHKHPNIGHIITAAITPPLDDAFDESDALF